MYEALLSTPFPEFNQALSTLSCISSPAISVRLDQRGVYTGTSHDLLYLFQPVSFHCAYKAQKIIKPFGPFGLGEE